MNPNRYRRPFFNRPERPSVLNWHSISNSSADKILNGTWPQRAGYRAMVLQSRYRRFHRVRDRELLLQSYAAYLDRQRDAAHNRWAMRDRIERNRRAAQWRLFVHRRGGVDSRGYFVHNI